MQKQRNWYSTLAFRRFRLKHFELSKIYWTHQLGVDCIRNLLADGKSDEFAIDVIGASFPKGMLPLKVDMTRVWLDTYLNRVRLHLLVICAANLESYIKSASFLFIAAKGFAKDVNTLNEVGKAMGAPILERSSLPEPLKYAEKLFGIDYGKHLQSWEKSYKLRSAMAHEGGVVTQKTIRDLPELKLQPNDLLELSWEGLRSSLASADEIASLTDMKISNRDVWVIETEKELLEMKRAGRLPHKQVVWKILNNQFAIRYIDRQAKQEIINRVY